MTKISTGREKIVKVFESAGLQEDETSMQMLDMIMEIISQTIKSTLKSVELEEMETYVVGGNEFPAINVGENQARKKQQANHQRELDKLK